jgi:uncharacterized HAD superfamily protein
MQKENQKVIGFDLDDVLLNFNEALAIYHNRNYGTNYERKDVSSFFLEKTWGCTREEAVNRIMDFYESPEHWGAKPVVGAVEAVRQLAQDHKLYIITSKPETLRERTLEWINTHFPGVFEDIHFTNHFNGDGIRRTKGEVCLELGVEVFVDDAPHYLESIVSHGVPALLFDTPWNQEYMDPKVTRVYSWEEIVEKISQ